MTSKLKSWYREWETGWRARWADGLDAPGARFHANLDMILVDHGFLRVFFTNLHEFAPGAWRSNQPSPGMIQRLAREGIRTIINLRGENNLGALALEREACAQAGITLISQRLYSRGAPRVAEIEGIREVFERAEKPMLIHCKSGADRAGLAAALYLLMIEKLPIEQAQQQLSLRYLHIKAAKTGVLDHFLQAYADFNAATPTPFLDWVHNHYDRDALIAEFKPSGLGELLVGGLLRRE